MSWLVSSRTTRRQPDPTKQAVLNYIEEAEKRKKSLLAQVERINDEIRIYKNILNPSSGVSG